MDGQGRVIATLDDYRVVHGLTREIFAASADLTVSKGVREVVHTTAKIIGAKEHGGDGFVTSAEVASALRRNRRVVNRAIETALEGLGTEAHKVRIGQRSLPAAKASVFPSVPEIVTAMGGNGKARPEPEEQAGPDFAGATDEFIF
jgi:hypothetical protein